MSGYRGVFIYETKRGENSFFQASQLTILLSYTIFAVLLVGETFLMKWETWPLVPIAIGVIASWVLHIRQSFSDGQRVWIYSAFIMFTFFFYGSHITSVFDTVAVMAVVMILYTMTGIRPLMTFLQFLYYITLAYGIVLLWRSGEKFDSLVISRTVFHVAVITAISCISRFIIKRWTEVLDRSDGEIEKRLCTSSACIFSVMITDVIKDDVYSPCLASARLRRI